MKKSKSPKKEEFMPEDYHTREEWLRMMSRAGFTPEFILKGRWSTIEVWGIISGWFDRVEDHKIIMQASGLKEKQEKLIPTIDGSENVDV